MSRYSSNQMRENVEYLAAVETSFSIDTQVLEGLRNELLTLAIQLPGAEADTENPHETVRSAIAALRTVINPPPTQTPKQQLAAKVAAHTKAVVENPKAFERARISAWADFFVTQSVEFADSDDHVQYLAKYNQLESCWSSINGCYENLPEGLVPEGWPETAADSTEYIRAEAERSLAPPGETTEPLPVEEPEEEVVPEDTEMHRMLERLSQPAQPPAHD